MALDFVKMMGGKSPRKAGFIGAMSSAAPKLLGSPDSSLDRTIQSNETMESNIAASGGQSPTGPSAPGFLERLLSVIDIPGTAARAVTHNLFDTKRPVDIAAEVGKAWEGERRVQGADIMQDVGITNPWVKGVGGFVLDVALDPLTYATAGYSGATKSAAKASLAKAADVGFDSATALARASEIANAAKAMEVTEASAPVIKRMLAESDHLAKVGKILDAAPIADDVTRALADGGMDALTRSQKLDLYHSFLKGAGEVMGDKGGIKFMGMSLGGQGALDKASDVGRAAAQMIPGAGLFSESAKLGLDPIEAAVRKSAEAARGISGNVRHAEVLGAMKALDGYTDDLIHAVPRAVESELTPDEWAHYGELKNVMLDATDKLAALEKREAAGEILDAADLAHKANFESTVADTGEQIVTMLKDAVPRTRERVYDSLISQGITPDEAARFADEGLPAYHAFLDRLSIMRREAKVGENLLVPEAQKAAQELGLTAPRSFGYVPHVPERAAESSGKLANLMDALGLTPKTAARELDPSVVRLAAEAGVDPADLRALGPGQVGAQTTATGGKQLFRREGATLPEFVESTMLAPKTDVRELLIGKAAKDYQAVANARAYDDLVQGFGRAAKTVTDKDGKTIHLISDGLDAAGEVAWRPLNAREAADLSFVTVKRKGVEETFAVPAKMASAWKDMDAAFTDDKAVKGFLRTFDAMQGVWKKSATRWNILRYNLRNGMWNAWLMWANDALDAETYFAGKKLMFGGKGALDDVMTHGGRTQTGAEWLRESLEWGGREGQFLKSQTGRDIEGVAKGVRGAARKLDEGVSSIANKVEDADRVSAYLHFIDKGMSPEQAGAAVRDTLYDFAPEAKTMFERNFMQRLIPFYSWAKANTGHMAELLAKNPRKIMWLPHLKDSMEAATGVDTSAMPEYMRELMPIPLPMKDASGAQVMWNTNAPVVDLKNFGIPLDPKEGFAQASALVRGPFEMLANKDVYYDEPISRYPGDVRRVPGYVDAFDRAVKGTPFAEPWTNIKDSLGIVAKTNSKGQSYLAADARALWVLKTINPWLNSVGKTMDSQNRSRYDLGAELSGVKVFPYDAAAAAESKVYDDFQKLSNAVAGMKARGTYTPIESAAPIKSKPFSFTVKQKRARRGRRLTLRRVVRSGSRRK
jgi:hypothetical protein